MLQYKMKDLAYHDHNNDKWNKQVHDEFLKDKQKNKKSGFKQH